MTTSPKIVVGMADGVPKATVAISAKMPEAKVNIHVTTDTDGLASKEYVDKKIAEIEFEAREETDPTVPAWAKQPEKPTYTAEEVGAQPKGDYALKSELPDVPVKSVNGQTGAVVLNAGNVGADAAGKAAEEAGKALNEAKGYTDQEIKKIPTPDVSAQINQHNENAQAHPAIRELITQLTVRLNALADSDDVTLDQLSEIVAYIKSNKSLIDAITTSKVSVGDIVNNLTTSAAGKPLSAAQGVVLKTMIEAITVPTMLSQLTGDATHRTVTDAEKAAWDAKSEFSGAYNDLTGKPTIPTVPTKVSAFENDKGYLTAVPAEYVTETELNGKGYLTQHQDISHKLDASALPGAINEALEQAKSAGMFDDMLVVTIGMDGDNVRASHTATEIMMAIAEGKRPVLIIGSEGQYVTFDSYLVQETGVAFFALFTMAPLDNAITSLVVVVDGQGGVETFDTAITPETLGALSADALPEAINDALAQAKATGQFDGKSGDPGKDGVSPTVNVSKSGKVTTVTIKDAGGTKTATINDGADGTSVTVSNVSTSSADGGSNVVTFSDGKTLTVKNGSQGSPGKTPVKGSDYYTSADKTEMVNAVLAALPTWTGGSY